jgi:hypothetical protein
MNYSAELYYEVQIPLHECSCSSNDRMAGGLKVRSYFSASIFLTHPTPMSNCLSVPCPAWGVVSAIHGLGLDRHRLHLV